MTLDRLGALLRGSNGSSNGLGLGRLGSLGLGGGLPLGRLGILLGSYSLGLRRNNFERVGEGRGGFDHLDSCGLVGAVGGGGIGLAGGLAFAAGEAGATRGAEHEGRRLLLLFLLLGGGIRDGGGGGDLNGRALLCGHGRGGRLLHGSDALGTGLFCI